MLILSSFLKIFPQFQLQLYNRPHLFCPILTISAPPPISKEQTEHDRAPSFLSPVELCSLFLFLSISSQFLNTRCTQKLKWPKLAEPQKHFLLTSTQSIHLSTGEDKKNQGRKDQISSPRIKIFQIADKHQCKIKSVTASIICPHYRT